ncbi:MAG TPA: hypothetical protein ENJ37_04355 [Deltaproteobacteria bacterium]|nr:hypothetical protein [Deltaproteobacteria bacterium]
MAREERQEEQQLSDPRYAPPYPQEFYRFWPRHVLTTGLIVVVLIAVLAGLSAKFYVPTDFNMAFPDDGMYIPGPEWYFLFLMQPFWYFAGESQGYAVLGTFYAPLLIVLLLVLTPFIFSKRRRRKKGFLAAALRLVPPVALFAAIFVSIYLVGSPAKVTGCIACHTPQYGMRQYLPPMDVAAYYATERQRQIKVGKFRAGKLDSEGAVDFSRAAQTYKDANWQLRHFYEPTFTW